MDSDSLSDDEDTKDQISDSSLSEDDNDEDNDDSDDDDDVSDDSDSDRNPFAKGSDSDDGIYCTRCTTFFLMSCFKIHFDLCGVYVNFFLVTESP